MKYKTTQFKTARILVCFDGRRKWRRGVNDGCNSTEPSRLTSVPSPSQVATWGGNNKRNWKDSILNGKLQARTHLITHTGEKSKKCTLEKSRTIATSKQVATTKLNFQWKIAFHFCVCYSLTSKSVTGQWSLQRYIFGGHWRGPEAKSDSQESRHQNIFYQGPIQGQEVVRESQESS